MDESKPPTLSPSGLQVYGDGSWRFSSDCPVPLCHHARRDVSATSQLATQHAAQASRMSRDCQLFSSCLPSGMASTAVGREWVGQQPESVWAAMGALGCWAVVRPYARPEDKQM